MIDNEANPRGINTSSVSGCVKHRNGQIEIFESYSNG